MADTTKVPPRRMNGRVAGCDAQRYTTEWNPATRVACFYRFEPARVSRPFSLEVTDYAPRGVDGERTYRKVRTFSTLRRAERAGVLAASRSEWHAV